MNSENKQGKDNSLLLIIGNCVLAVSAWTIGAYLLMHDHPIAGGWMIAMPLLFHFSQSKR